MEDKTVNTEKLLKRMDAVIEQIEEVIGTPEVSADVAARVQFEEGLCLLRNARKKIEEGPNIQ